MMQKIDWDSKSETDKAFLVGYMLSQYSAAIQNITQAVLTLSLSGGNERLDFMAFNTADSAIITIGNTDFSKVDKPDMYYEIAQYSPDFSQIIKQYAALRKEKKFTSYCAEVEDLIQKTLSQLGKD
jgi:hypothetical protein